MFCHVHKVFPSSVSITFFSLEWVKQLREAGFILPRGSRDTGCQGRGRDSAKSSMQLGCLTSPLDGAGTRE